MLPQTNLQLYRLLIEQGASEADLVLVRNAYDLARQLFSGCYRPSHKPFVAHLIGVAGALVFWGEPVETVVAGMLHSAYLYGDYGDGKRGAAKTRRRFTRGCVGERAEELIYGYTSAKWTTPVDQVAAEVTAGNVDRTIVVIKLADLCDDCCDGEAKFAPGKPLEFGLPGDRNSRRPVANLLATLVGAPARTHFLQLLAANDVFAPPVELQTSDRSFHVVDRVDERHGSPMIRRFYRLARRVRLKRAG